MLSHKAGPITDPVRSTPSYVRQSLSAVRVISILSNECPENLASIAVVPYALSTAMTVAYRQMRQSKLQTHKNRAKQDIKTCVSLLERVRKSRWSAGAMADLGKAVLAKIDREAKGKSGERAHPRTEQRQRANTNTDSKKEAAQEPAKTAPTQDNLTNQAPVSDMLMPPASGPVPAHIPTANGQQLLSRPTMNYSPSPASTLPFNESPDWMNFDNAFENIDSLLGAGGSDLTYELLKPFNYEGMNPVDWPLTAPQYPG